MQTVATIGLDIAKSIFQVHGVDAGGQASPRRCSEDQAVVGRRPTQPNAPPKRPQALLPAVQVRRAFRQRYASRCTLMRNCERLRQN